MPIALHARFFFNDGGEDQKLIGGFGLTELRAGCPSFIDESALSSGSLLQNNEITRAAAVSISIGRQETFERCGIRGAFHRFNAQTLEQCIIGEFGRFGREILRRSQNILNRP